MFILRQKLFMAVIVLSSLGCAGLLLRMTQQNGKLDGQTGVILVGIALLCGGGAAVLTVLPGFMIYRWLFTRPPEPELLPGERVLFTTPANHALDGEGRGGKLHLTEQRMVFCPHRFNVQLALWTAPWQQVASASVRDSALVGAVAMVVGVDDRGLQNFLFVKLVDGTTVGLVVKQREQVARLIEQVRGLEPAERAAALASAGAQAPSAGQLH